LHNGLSITDPLLAALVAPTIPEDPEDRLKLVKDCLRANRTGKSTAIRLSKNWLK